MDDDDKIDEELIAKTIEVLTEKFKELDQASDESENDEIKFFNDNITPEIRNSIMITLAKIIDGLNISKVKKDNESTAIYTISSNDGIIHIDINMDDDKENNLKNFEMLVKYAFDKNDFIYDEMNNEREIIENVAKFFNGFICNLAESENEVEEKQEYSLDYLTPAFHDKYTTARTELTTLIYNSGELSEKEYLTLISARFLLDNIIEENIFFCGSEMIDFIHTTITLTKAFPELNEEQLKLHNFCKAILDSENQ